EDLKQDAWHEGQDQGTPAWRRGLLQIPTRSPGNILLPWNQKPGQGLHLSKPQPEIQGGRGCSQVRNRVARAISNGVHEPEELELNSETKPFSSVTSFPRSSLNQWLERAESQTPAGATLPQAAHKEQE